VRALSTVLIAIALVALFLAIAFVINGPGGTDSGDLYLWVAGAFGGLAVICGWLGVTIARRCAVRPAPEPAFSSGGTPEHLRKRFIGYSRDVEPSIRVRVDALLAKERLRRPDDDSVEEAFARLYADDVPPYDALLVVEELFDIPFHESKKAAAASPTYGPAFAASDGVREAAEAALDELAQE
jgi:hypothetical protein